MDLQHAFNKLKDENEVAIVEKYSFIGKRYTIVLTAFGICAISIYILIQFWSTIIAFFVVSMNVSQSYQLLITTEYFIDQEKYFYLIVLHISSTFCIGIIIMVGIGTIFITYLQHTYGMFRIASYRIEHAISINILQNITLKNKILMTEGIAYGVDFLGQAMKLSKQMLSTFEIMFFGLIICGVFCLSVNLFQMASPKNTFEEMCFPFIYVFLTVVYMFVSNYVGQDVVDHNNRIFSTAYNVQWYKAPIHVQKMILFLLQRETKEFTLNVGRLFNASMECFATLVKTSISYFTVIYSTR
ncbi:uncharacterized protein LOC113004049 [Solenopsis invicta]|uniref:uncharacterized protein LOC113004049 n=1 Tax=Solenopsis invicta TaxID=13686 RepID=UPI00193E0423|nr:uncharacterized protein LOC113004049 [Solenopsis invicta]